MDKIIKEKLGELLFTIAQLEVVIENQEQTIKSLKDELEVKKED